MSLVYYERWMGARAGSKSMLGPGAASAAEFEANWVAGLSPGKWLALLIATGIGLHNFSEGLAIGQAGATGEIGLALVLIIGFGLHNATEGFGIVAPHVRGAAELEVPRAPRPDRRRPDVRRHAHRPGLDERGAVGRVLRPRRWLDPLRRLQLVKVMQRMGHPVLVAWMIIAGLMLGFGTELVLKAAGV